MVLRNSAQPCIPLKWWHALSDLPHTSGAYDLCVHSDLHELSDLSDLPDIYFQQESTSEDVNFYYAMTMWAIATGNAELEGLGRLQTGVVTRSIKEYFLLKDSNTNHTPDFVRNKVSPGSCPALPCPVLPCAVSSVSCAVLPCPAMSCPLLCCPLRCLNSLWKLRSTRYNRKH